MRSYGLQKGSRGDSQELPFVVLAFQYYVKPSVTLTANGFRTVFCTLFLTHNETVSTQLDFHKRVVLDLWCLKKGHCTVYLLSDIGEICPENADCDQSLSARPTASVIFPPERKRRKMGVVRKRLLDSISDYLYSRAQKVHTAEERDAFTLALAIMHAVRHDEPHPFETACYRAFGSSLKVYLKRRAQEQWVRHQELVACIPDYDPQEARHAQVIPSDEVRGREAGPGRVYEMPQPTQPTVQKSVRSLP